jgi:hypothetical protein
MTRPTTSQLATILRAWRDGSELLDTLGPRTDAILATLAVKPHTAPCQKIDTSTMNETELRAYYAKTAHVEDIRFHLRCALGRVDEPDWRALLAQVEQQRGKSTPDTKRRYLALCQAARERHVLEDQQQHQRQAAA